MNDQMPRIANREVPTGSGSLNLVVSSQGVGYSPPLLPSIVLSMLLIPGDKITEGTLVKAVSRA